MQKMTTAEAQKQLINIVKSVTQENESYQINDERGSAILISQNTYESLEETIELLSIPNLRESLQDSLQQIKNNETYSFDKIFGNTD
jgi:PHD/YefM family antitoxin component YafN of YafNO toxin-antitoxin module